MINALKNQPKTLTRDGDAHVPPPSHANLARNDVIAKTPLTAEGELQKQANNLVGQTFFGTLLKQMRDSPFKSDLFSGGRGGQAFSEMFDQTLAMRMSQRSGQKLTRPIVKKFKAAAADAYERNKNFQKEHVDVAHRTRA